MSGETLIDKKMRSFLGSFLNTLRLLLDKATTTTTGEGPFKERTSADILQLHLIPDPDFLGFHHVS